MHFSPWIDIRTKVHYILDMTRALVHIGVNILHITLSAYQTHFPLHRNWFFSLFFSYNSTLPSFFLSHLSQSLSPFILKFQSLSFCHSLSFAHSLFHSFSFGHSPFHSFSFVHYFSFVHSLDLHKPDLVSKEQE